MRTKIKTIERFSFAGKGTVSGNIALDLLDAMNIIKEMREEINLTLRDFEKIDEVCKMANVMPFSLTKKKLCEVMEKTKEYAE